MLAQKRTRHPSPSVSKKTPHNRLPELLPRLPKLAYRHRYSSPASQGLFLLLMAGVQSRPEGPAPGHPINGSFHTLGTAKGSLLSALQIFPLLHHLAFVPLHAKTTCLNPPQLLNFGRRIEGPLRACHFLEAVAS